MLVVSSSDQHFSGHTVGCVIGKPSTLAVGDLWVAHLHYLNNGSTVTIPGGWTTLDTISNTGVTYTILSFYKIADAGDVANPSPSVSFSIGTNGTCITENITGFDTVTPFGTPQHDNQGGVFIFTSSKSVTPTDVNSIALFSYGEHDSFNPGMGNSGDTAFGTPDGTITNIQSFANGSGGLNSGCVVYDLRAGVTPTNGWVVNPASNFADWCGMVVIVNPAAVVPGVSNSNFLAFMG